MTPDANQPDHGFSLPKSRTRTRAALLGAVAVAALAGAGMNAGFLSSPLHAQALNQSIPQVGPASFAPLVDKVKGAVVSVRVKTIENSDASDNNDGGHMQRMPQFGQNDPLDRFFRQFGEDGGRFHQKPQKGMALG
ncbi:MAG: hypothetical protein KGM42_10785, partial [Hyphomicrobiales bacterium]|nr:hypothetical protein [Hyphomicrobiales bacterium]